MVYHIAEESKNNQWHIDIEQVGRVSQHHTLSSCSSFTATIFIQLQNRVQTVPKVVSLCNEVQIIAIAKSCRFKSGKYYPILSSLVV